MAGMEELRIPMSGLHVGLSTQGVSDMNGSTLSTTLTESPHIGRPASRMTVESPRSNNSRSARATPVKGLTISGHGSSPVQNGMCFVPRNTAEMRSSSSVHGSHGDSVGSSSSAITTSTGRSYTSQSLSHSSSRSRHDCGSAGYTNDYSEVDYNTSIPQQKRRNSLETMDTSMSVSEDLYTVNECYNKLMELELVPWNERDVLNVLREARTKDLSGHISVEMMQRLSYLLQRPLLRIAREAQRLSMTFHKCTRHEVHTAMKLILSRSLSESCLQACLKAVALYAMSGDNFRQSKSSRCGLHFSVGKFHRWMIDAQVSLVVHEYAAIYMAACMENLLEEIVLLSISTEHLGEAVLGVDVLDFGIANNAELWGILQPYEHLICGRNSSGVLSLPSSMVLCGNDYYRVKGRKYERAHDPLMKNVEQCLLATCVGSLAELVELVSRAMHFWYSKPCGAATGPKQHPVTWGGSALHALHHYMKCSQLEHADNPNIMPPTIHINYERSYSVLPPLIEWIRVGIAHTEHRRSWVVDDDDVRQAARLLLPGADCPPRLFSTDESLCTSRHLDAQKCAVKFQQDVALRMLACGRSDLLPHAIALLGTNQINTFNDQGMTPLMYACMKGDEAMAQMLLDAGAELDISVPGDMQNHPCVHPETKYWTALTFASVHCHMAIVQLLLERGARVEGSVRAGEDNYSESPLQLAAAAGHYELVAMLMSKGADPYLSTVHKKGITYNTSTRGSYNSFALAAAHGHRNILRKLLSQPVKSKVADILSLEEILAEGNSNTFENSQSNARQEKLKCQAEQNVENESFTENVYVTIEEVALEDNQFLAQTKFSKDKPKFSKTQLHSLQEALYHAAENGFLDITLELRNLGVPWSMHSWAQSLATAQRLSRRSLINCLLKDFVTIRQEEYNADFICETLPLMFDIFKQNKNEQLSQQLATVFSALFGPAPMPPIQELKTTAVPRIDSRYVNSPEMSDVQFLIEGKMFFGHKIILVNASHRFKAMLSDQICENANSSLPCIEINNIKYHIFEKLMQFLYNGSAENKAIDPNDILEVMAAANFFLLEGLQRHCEIILSKKLNSENCILIYKHARLYNALELMAYCEGFFIQHLSSLLRSNEQYKKLVFGTKLQNYDVVNGLLATLTQRLEEKLKARNKKPFR